MTFIRSVRSDSKDITLKKYGSPGPELLITDQDTISIAFLDTETTGIDRSNDKIIEIALKLVKVEAQPARLLP